jgi:hypothetical protein
MPERTYSFEVRRASRASAATLFRLETDANAWAEWAKPLVLKSGWEAKGDPSPHGSGAVRKLWFGPALMREKTIECDQDRRHVYALLSPSTAAKDYLGEVTFTPRTDGGTDVVWSGTFTEALRGTGPVVRVALQTTVGFILARLTHAAERE